MIEQDATGWLRRSQGILAAALLAGLALAPLAAAAAPEESSWCSPGCAHIVADWSLTAYSVVRAANGYADPMAATRVLASMHLATHDAANAAEAPAEATPVAAGSERADAAMAAAVAAHDVLAGFFPDQATITDAALAAMLLDAGVGPSVDAGGAVGAAAAAAVLADLADDGADVVENWPSRRAPATTGTFPAGTSSSGRTGARFVASCSPRRTSSAPILHRRSTARPMPRTLPTSPRRGIIGALGRGSRVRGLLVRVLRHRLEPRDAGRGAAAWARPLGQRAPLRARRRGDGGQLHRRLGLQDALGLLATRDRDRNGGRGRQRRDRGDRRMGALPADAADPGPSLDTRDARSRGGDGSRCRPRRRGFSP